MANIFQNLAVATASVALSIAVIDITPAKAAVITYDFDVVPDFGPLEETYWGSLSYDDSSLTGSGEEFIRVSDLNLDFLDVQYTETDGLADPEAVFFDGQFLGLSFSADDFSFMAGLFDISDAWFAYDIDDLGVGTADVIYKPHTSVPEPNTLLGLTIIGGGWLVRKTIRAGKKR